MKIHESKVCDKCYELCFAKAEQCPNCLSRSFVPIGQWHPPAPETQVKEVEHEKDCPVRIFEEIASRCWWCGVPVTEAKAVSDAKPEIHITTPEEAVRQGLAILQARSATPATSNYKQSSLVIRDDNPCIIPYAPKHRLIIGNTYQSGFATDNQGTLPKESKTDRGGDPGGVRVESKSGVKKRGYRADASDVRFFSDGKVTLHPFGFVRPEEKHYCRDSYLEILRKKITNIKRGLVWIFRWR